MASLKRNLVIVMETIGAVQSKKYNIFCGYGARGCLPEALLEFTGEVLVGNHGQMNNIIFRLDVPN